MSDTIAITSIGHACAVLQRPYKSIERALEALSIRPACTINGVPHLADSDVERIREHLQAKEQR